MTSKIIQIPGSQDIRVSVVHNDDNKGESRSPEWMVQIDTLCHSNVLGFEMYTELLGWYGESSRHTNSSIGNSQLMTSATIRHSEVILIVPLAGYAPTLEHNMNTGKPLDFVSIVRLGHIFQVKVILQKIDYEVCRIHSIQQDLDQLIIRMNVTRKTNTIFVYDQAGAGQGQVVTKTDYQANTVDT